MGTTVYTAAAGFAAAAWTVYVGTTYVTAAAGSAATLTADAGST